MRKSSFELTLGNFYQNMGWDIDFLMKVEKTRKVIKSVYEKRNVFEAYVFRICANWEILVEDLLIDCLNKDTTRYADFTGYKIPTHISREMCCAIILGISYLDFKSTHNLKDVSKKILVPACNPFTEIPRANGAKIGDFFAFRNYLAHYSDAAKRALEKIYKNKYNLAKFREPGDFLLAKDREESLPRMALYINNFIDTADIMAKFLGITVR
ncbi:MAG: hypothetical protein FJ025_03600 [Chloroflexi bacterium]|nr:hypothetical protein [Chloroflexota bacterium]